MPIYQFQYQQFANDKELDIPYFHLLSEAKKITDNAYAPYSNFKVGCAILLQNDEIMHGVNIENAAFPVGICAERSALASALSQYPDEKIKAIAISYISTNNTNDTPIFPCGMCRQFISECEDRNETPIPLLLAAQEGVVIVLNSVKDILPFSFGNKNLI